MGENQLTIRDYLRHNNVHVTNKYLHADSVDQPLGTGQGGRRYFVDWNFAQYKPDPMNAVSKRFRWEHSRSALVFP
jgi:hypothetical protein